MRRYTTLVGRSGPFYFLPFVSLSARAQTFRVSGFLIARGVGARSQPSWLSGGFGRFDTGARSASDTTTTNVEVAQFGMDWTPRRGSTRTCRASPVTIRREAGDVEWDSLRRTPICEEIVGRASSASVNFFSRPLPKNTDNLWTSPYTITLSALTYMAWGMLSSSQARNVPLRYDAFARSIGITVSRKTIPSTAAAGPSPGSSSRTHPCGWARKLRRFRRPARRQRSRASIRTSEDEP